MILAVVAVLFFVVPPLFVLLLQHDRSAANLNVLLITIAQGAGFAVFAGIVGGTSARRAEDVADAAIISATEELSVGGARSLLRSDDQAILVAARARAALRHFARASEDRRAEVIKSIRAAYADLAFGVFARADAHSRSMWNVLIEDGKSVLKEIEEAQDRLDWPRKSDQEALQELAAFVTFVLSIGAAVRERGEKNRFGSGPLSVTIGGDSEDPKQWVRHVQSLYETELTVKRAWSIVTENIADFSFSVHLGPLPEFEETGPAWLAPWYVENVEHEPEKLRPVNVAGGRLNEQAKYDEIVQTQPPQPVWPEPLEHSRLPPGLREQGIAAMRDLLKLERGVQTTCVLAYEFTKDSKRRRLILDGNHRLAAAYAMSLRPTVEAAAAGPASRAALPRSGPRGRPAQRVLMFLVSEGESPGPGVTDKVSEKDHIDPAKDEAWVDTYGPWAGFTPDVGLIRGCWRPHHSQTRPTIVGDVKPGEIVHLDEGTWTVDKLPLDQGGIRATITDFTYKWLLDDQEIPKATGTSYSIRETDGGHQLSVEVIAKTIEAWVTAHSESVDVPHGAT